MNIFNFLKNNTSRGFTLVESLIAISIFTTTVLGLLGLIAQGVSDSNQAKKQVAASYLAQEGIEYMRNMRDTYVVYDSISSQHGWDAYNTKVAGGLYPAGTTACGSSNGCYFDRTQPMNGSNIVSCNSTSCPELLFDSSTGKYGYASGTGSGFFRKIQTVQTGANGTKILSTVFWTRGLEVRSITFSEGVLNWIE